METLRLFEKIGFDISKFLPAGASEYITPTLAGAGIGATGLGLSAMMGGPDDETGDQKRNRVMKDILLGGTLGASAGAGGKALYDKFLNPESGLPQGAKAMLDREGTGNNLITKPLSQANPGLNIGYQTANTDPAVWGAAGAAGGLGVNAMNAHKINTMKDAFSETSAATEAHAPKDLAAAWVKHVKASGGGSAIKSRGLDEAMKYMQGSHRGQTGANQANLRSTMANNFARTLFDPNKSDKQGQRAANIANMNAGDHISQSQSRASQYAQSGYNPSSRLSELKMKYLKAMQGPDAAADAVKGFTAKHISKVPGLGNNAGSRLAGVGRAAGYGLGGAGIGLAAQQGSQYLIDKIIKNRYSDNQLDYWRQF